MSSINSDRVRDFLKGLYSSSLDSTIVTAGNGGSHANASHLTADLIRRNVPSVCLTDNQAALSAFSNDFNYDTALSRILSNQFRFHPAVVVILFSVSGESTNLINLANEAKKLRCPVFSVLGNSRCTLNFVSNDSIYVESNNYGLVETIHSLFAHLIADTFKPLW